MAKFFQMQRWQVIEWRLPGWVPLQSKYNIPADPVGLVSLATWPAWMFQEVVRTFQQMGGNFQPRAVVAPRPLHQLRGCATASVGGCWPNVAAEVCCGFLPGVFGGIKTDFMGCCWSCAGARRRCRSTTSHGTNQARPRCLPTRHLCPRLGGALADAVGSQHQVNGGEMSESVILIPPAQTQAPGRFTTPGCLLKTEAALPNSK